MVALEKGSTLHFLLKYGASCAIIIAKLSKSDGLAFDRAKGCSAALFRETMDLFSGKGISAQNSFDYHGTSAEG